MHKLVSPWKALDADSLRMLATEAVPHRISERSLDKRDRSDPAPFFCVYLGIAMRCSGLVVSVGMEPRTGCGSVTWPSMATMWERGCRRTRGA